MLHLSYRCQIQIANWTPGPQGEEGPVSPGQPLVYHFRLLELLGEGPGRKARRRLSDSAGPANNSKRSFEVGTPWRRLQCLRQNTPADELLSKEDRNKFALTFLSPPVTSSQRSAVSQATGVGSGGKGLRRSTLASLSSLWHRAHLMILKEVTSIAGESDGT